MEDLVGWITEGEESRASALDMTEIGISVMVVSKVATVEVVISTAGSSDLRIDDFSRSNA